MKSPEKFRKKLATKQSKKVPHAKIRNLFDMWLYVGLAISSMDQDAPFNGGTFCRRTINTMLKLEDDFLFWIDNNNMRLFVLSAAGMLENYLRVRIERKPDNYWLKPVTAKHEADDEAMMISVLEIIEIILGHQPGARASRDLFKVTPTLKADYSTRKDYKRLAFERVSELLKSEGCEIQAGRTTLESFEKQKNKYPWMNPSDHPRRCREVKKFIEQRDREIE